MKNKYFDKVAKLLARVRPKLSATHRLEFKNVFGSVGGYTNGHIFISCGKFGVALRLPPRALGILSKEKHVKHLKYFPNGHIKKEYAVIPKRILQDDREIRKLLNESIKYVLQC